MNFWRSPETAERVITALVAALLLGIVALVVYLLVVGECPKGSRCLSRAPAYTTIMPVFVGSQVLMLPQTMGGECLECGPVSE